MPYRVVIEPIATPKPPARKRPPRPSEHKLPKLPKPAKPPRQPKQQPKQPPKQPAEPAPLPESREPPSVDPNVETPLGVVVANLPGPLAEAARNATKQLAARHNQLLMIHSPSGAWSDFTPVKTVCDALADRVAELLAAPDSTALVARLMKWTGTVSARDRELQRRLFQTLRSGLRLARATARCRRASQTASLGRALALLRRLGQQLARQRLAERLARQQLPRLNARALAHWRAYRSPSYGPAAHHRLSRALRHLRRACRHDARATGAMARALVRARDHAESSRAVARWIRARALDRLGRGARERSLLVGWGCLRAEQAVHQARCVELAHARGSVVLVTDRGRFAVLGRALGRLRGHTARSARAARGSDVWGRTRRLQVLTRFRLLLCRIARWRVRAFAAEFGDVDQLTLDAMLGVDQGLLVGGIATAFLASARLWARAIASPSFGCGCGEAGDARGWVKHIVRSANNLGTSGQGCANRPRVRPHGKYETCSQRHWCQRFKGPGVTCPTCDATYCSAKCRDRHHLDRGHGLVCGLFESKADGHLISAVQRLGDWLAVQPTMTLMRADPHQVICRLVAAAAIERYRQGRARACSSESLPLEFLDYSRLVRAGHRACLVHDAVAAMDDHDPKLRVLASVVALGGGLAARDVVECVATALMIRKRARLEIRTSCPAAPKVAAELGQGGVPVFWKAQWVTRRAYSIAVEGGREQDLLRAVRRQVWGNKAAVLQGPVADCFSTHFSTETPVPTCPPHKTDPRVGYGTAFTVLAGLLIAETDFTCDDHQHFIVSSEEFVTVGTAPLPLLERMQAVVRRQVHGYPTHAEVDEPITCLAQSLDMGIELQVHGLMLQQRYAKELWELVSGLWDPDNESVLRMGLVGYLLWHETGGGTARMLACTIRTCLYGVARATDQLRVASLLSICLAAISLRCPISRLVGRWMRRAGQTRATDAIKWLPTVMSIEQHYPELHIVNQPVAWFVVRQLGDMGSVRIAADKSGPASHAARVWGRLQYDRV